MCNCGKIKLSSGHEIFKEYQHTSSLFLLHEPFEYVAGKIKEGTFLDLGAGDGQALEVATFHFEDMDIKGIEIDPDYAGDDKRIIIGNMFNFKNLIHSVSVIYIYEPFEKRYMDTLMNVVIPNTQTTQYIILNTVGYEYTGKLEVLKRFKDPRDIPARENILILKNN